MNPYPVLSGETLVVPIVGDPIAQVKSPDGITRTFAARGCNAVVVPLQVGAEDLDALVRGLGTSGSVAGIIATVPHKFGLTAHCATLTDRARVPRVGQRRPPQPGRQLARRPGRRRRLRHRRQGQRR